MLLGGMACLQKAPWGGFSSHGSCAMSSCGSGLHSSHVAGCGGDSAPRAASPGVQSAREALGELVSPPSEEKLPAPAADGQAGLW